jgi:uncharacterized protein (TIGR03086 family)
MSNDKSIYNHRQACYGFGAVVDTVSERWERPSPCPGWDARGVVEHVIGFHEVLLLRPLGVKANRPKGDIPSRWTATQLAIFTALDMTRGDTVELPDGSILDMKNLLPPLTTDVLVHTWDLAKAVGVDAALSPELCERALAGARSHEDQLRSAGMFGTPIDVHADADVQSRLVAFLGRDPHWPES